MLKLGESIKKAIKAAKINCKTINANRLRQSLKNINFNKFWDIVNGGKVGLTGSEGADNIRSFVSSFNTNFVDSADNTIAVKNYLLASCMKNDGADVLVDVEDIERTLA